MLYQLSYTPAGAVGLYRGDAGLASDLRRGLAVREFRGQG